MDCAYVDFARLYRSSKSPGDRSTGLRCDQMIRPAGVRARISGSPAPYPDIEAEHGLSFVFLAKLFEFPALQVGELYRTRWRDELFFRWIKYHLRIRSLIGTSHNAVSIQIWTAIVSYLLVAKVLKLEPSLHEILQVFK